MATQNASSVPNAFATDVMAKLRNETSAARLFAKDAANNPNGVTWDQFMDIVRRSVKGMTGYPMGGASTGYMFGSKKVGVTGSYAMPASSLGLTTIVAYGANYAGSTTLNSGTLVSHVDAYVRGSTVVVSRVWITSGTGVTLKYSAAKQSVLVWAVGAGS